VKLASCAPMDGWGDRTLPFLHSAGVTQAPERVLAVDFGNKLCWFESHYRHICVAQAAERVLAVAFGNKLCWFVSHYQHISLCGPGRWTRASSSLRKKTMFVPSPTISIFLYVAQADERVLAVAFGNKLCRFESHYRHISLCSPGSWKRASSSLWK